MEEINENEVAEQAGDSQNTNTKKPKTQNRPVSAGVIIAALIAGYALGYFPPKKVAAESAPPVGVTAPAPSSVAPTAPIQRAPSGGGGCGV